MQHKIVFVICPALPSAWNEEVQLGQQYKPHPHSSHIEDPERKAALVCVWTFMSL